MKDLHQVAFESREAFYTLAFSSEKKRNITLKNIANILTEYAADIFVANQADIQRSEKAGLPIPLLNRLKFDQAKLDQVILGLNSLQNLPDPLGKTTLSSEITPGLELYRVSCPIGVIGVIFESRPDALV